MAPKRNLEKRSFYDETKLVETLQSQGLNRENAVKIWAALKRRELRATRTRPDAKNNAALADLDTVEANQHGGSGSGSGFALTDIDDLQKACYGLLVNFVPMTTKIIEHSSTDNTTKLIIQLQDGYNIESVIMRHQHDVRVKDEESKNPPAKSRSISRTTLCVSSQVGCKMGCEFCATGTLGELGNLTGGEILEQLVWANRVLGEAGPIRNVVFMGMGEPLNNYEAVMTAIRGMTDTRRFGLSPKRITVSTVGIAPRMLSLAKQEKDVNLALSLHAPTQDMRVDIMPSARAFPIKTLMSTLDEYINATGRKVLVQYILLHGLNDTDEAADDLGKLLRGRHVTLNCIPYNPNYAVGISRFAAPTAESIQRFTTRLKELYGVFVTVRKTMGQDIAGACGQLALQTKANVANEDGKGSKAGKIADIEDLLGGRAKKATPKGRTIRSRHKRQTGIGESPKQCNTSSKSEEGKGHLQKAPATAIGDLPVYYSKDVEYILICLLVICLSLLVFLLVPQTN